MTKEKLQAELVRDEALRLAAYQDSLGYWTIGVGRLIDARKGGGITVAEAMMLLSNDIDRIERDVGLRWPWYARLDDVRQRVMINMAFNLGIGGLSGFKRTLGSVERGEYAKAAQEMMQSTWATQVKGRATRLARMMHSGQDV